MDYSVAAKRHRYQAEEARAKAELMGDEGGHATQYLRVAAAYDAMADNEERLADNGIANLAPPNESDVPSPG